MSASDDIDKTLTKSAKLSRELSDLAKEKIKDHLTMYKVGASSLDEALKLKQLAEYLDNSASELEGIVKRNSTYKPSGYSGKAIWPPRYGDKSNPSPNLPTNP